MAGGSYQDEHKRTKLKGAHAEPETLYEGSPSLLDCAVVVSCRVYHVSCAVCSHYGVSNGAGVMADLPTAHLHKNLTWSGLIEGSAHTFALSEMVRPAHTPCSIALNS
jgi:hypothetical protein